MLCKNAISSARPIASNLATTGLIATAVPGTWLGELFDTCHTPLVDNKAWVGDRSASDIMDQIVRALEIPTFDSVPAHEKKMDELATFAAQTLGRNISHARNKVKPVILAVVNDVDMQRKEKQVTIANIMSIVPDTYESIWNSPVLADMVSMYQDVPRLGWVSKTTLHPGKTQEEVLELLKTGSTRFDNEVKKLVEEIGIDFVYQVYNDFFVVQSDENPGAVASYFQGVGPVYRKRALLCFLMASRLKQDVQPGINMSADAYEQLITAVIAQAGLAINNVIDFRERQKKNKVLVSQWPMQGAEYRTSMPDLAQIVVVADVYEAWLRDGGTPEILMGAFVLDRNEQYSKLIERGEEYTNAWRQRCSYVRSAQTSELYKATIDCVRDAVTRQINSLDEQELPQGVREPMHRALAASLQKCTITESENLYSMCRRIVCESMFDHTECGKILDTIDRLGAREQDLPPRELASLAVMEIMTRWMADQIVIERAK